MRRTCVPQRKERTRARKVSIHEVGRPRKHLRPSCCSSSTTCSYSKRQRCELADKSSIRSKLAQSLPRLHELPCERAFLSTQTALAYAGVSEERSSCNSNGRFGDRLHCRRKAREFSN